MSGDITTNRLTALSSVANALMKSIEGSDLEERIKALEEKVAGAKEMNAEARIKALEQATGSTVTDR